MLNVLSIDFINQWVELECPYEDLEGGDNISAIFYEIELMQYAGLIDKHGKRIYEGDIIKTRYVWEKDPYIVDFDEGFFMYNRSNPKDRVALDGWGGSLEVLGNIYENPEFFFIGGYVNVKRNNRTND